MTIQLSQLPGQDRPVNQDIHTLISDLVWAALETDKAYRATIDPFEAAVEEVAKKFPGGGSVMRGLDDGVIGVADIYGRVMFRLGLELGRNPSALLWLPDGSYMQGETHHE